ncbi:MAG: YciI family protein [Aureliella sp.]
MSEFAKGRSKSPTAHSRIQPSNWGYYIIDVDNLDEAIAIAATLPPAKKGTVEIRPLFSIASTN